MKSASYSSSSRLSNHIPSRERERERITSESASREKESQNPVKQKLELARIEGRRREANALAKELKSLSTKDDQKAHERFSRTSLAAKSPSSSNNSSTVNTSASSRAASLFYSSTSLSSAEAQENERRRRLKRQVAGPIPPSSWQEEFEQRRIRNETPPHLQGSRRIQKDGTLRDGRRPSSDLSASSSDIERSSLDARLRAARDRRRSACSYTRILLSDDPSKMTLSSNSSRSKSSSNLLSLSDLALLSILSFLSQPSQTPEDQESQVYSSLLSLMHLLPTHLKLRMSELAGRDSRTDYPIPWKVFRALWIPTEREEKIGSANLKGKGKGKMKESEKDHLGYETPSTPSNSDEWENSSSSSSSKESQDALSTSSSQQTLDLSFIHLTFRNINSLIHLSPMKGTLNFNLAKLSFAGFGSFLLLESTFTSGSDSTDYLILGSESTISILSSLPNLRVLSLAHTSLKPPIRNFSTSSILPPALFFKKLARVTPRLESLDLSECDWVESKTIGGVNWSNEGKNLSEENRPALVWNQLETLVLKGCKSLNPSRIIEQGESEDYEKNIIGVKAGVYLEEWHSEFHSILFKSLASSRQPQGLNGGRAPTARQGGQTQVSNNPEVLTAFEGQELSQVETRNVSPFSSTFPTRDTLGNVIELFEWERARVLDLVRGRGNDGWSGERKHFAGDRKFVEVYF